MNDWQKQIRLLWWSQLIAVAAMEMSEPFWPLFLRQLQGVDGESLTLWSALIYGAPLLVAGFAAPIWGRLGDRFGHKPMVLRSMLGLMLTQALLYFSSSLGEVLLYRLLQGALAGIITAALCFASAVAPPANRAAVVGRLTAATATGAIIGPVLGGALAQWLDYRAIFLTSAVICLLLLVVLASQLDRDRPQPSVTTNPAATPTFRGGLPVLTLLLLAILLLQSAKAMPTSFFALFAEQQLATTPLLTGLLFSAAGFGMMLSASRWGQLFDRLTPASGLALLSGIALTAASCYLAHLYSGWLLLLCVRFIWGVCLGAMLPMVQAIMIQLSSTGRNGRLIGTAQSCIRFGNLAGVSIGALIMSQWGYSGGFFGAALAYLLAGAVLLLAGSRLSPTLGARRAPIP